MPESRKCTIVKIRNPGVPDVRISEKSDFRICWKSAFPDFPKYIMLTNQTISDERIEKGYSKATSIVPAV